MLVEMKVKINDNDVRIPISPFEKPKMYFPKRGTVVTIMLLTALIETVAIAMKSANKTILFFIF